MKRFSEILGDLPVEEVRGDLSTMIRQIALDSRVAGRDDLFVAIRGFRVDGHQFIPQAFQNGCRAFIVEEPVDLDDTVVVRVKDTRRLLPYLSRNFYDHVADEMKLVGITGTNGKTTTAYLIFSILEAADWKPGLISTVETIIGAERRRAERTTPESLELHQMFQQMRRKGRKSVVMEVSSHALELHRTDGIGFSAAVFTNLGRDHLDFHETMENYFCAKQKLFAGLSEFSRAVINADDPYSERLMNSTPADIFTFSLDNPNATVSLVNCRMISDGMSLKLKTPAGEFFCSTSLVGKHNIANVLAAAATGVALGIQEEVISRGIQAVGNVPGRCEKYVSPAGFRVYIDYAHTPQALKRILEALLELRPGRLTVVFGCGGDRDRGKRPQMGKIAEDYADRIILTNDNPRSEDPQKIIDEIAGGMYDRSKVQVIPDRHAAIETALRQARRNEIVLVAGKGHENYQEFSDRRLHFDDRLVVEEFLGARESAAGRAG